MSKKLDGKKPDGKTVFVVHRHASYPQKGETIEVETWPAAFSKFKAWSKDEMAMVCLWQSNPNGRWTKRHATQQYPVTFTQPW